VIIGAFLNIEGILPGSVQSQENVNLLSLVCFLNKIILTVVARKFYNPSNPSLLTTV